MSNLRRRRRSSIDYPGAEVISPTTDSGWKRYTTGREMLLAADPNNTLGVASSLIYPLTANLYNSATMAFRFCPLWAGNTAQTADFFLMRNAADSSYSIYVQKGGDTNIYANLRGSGVVARQLSSAAITAGSVNALMCRWTQGGSGKMNLKLNGVDAAETNNTETIATGAKLYVGCSSTTPVAYGGIGPFVVIPAALSSAEATTIDLMLRAGVTGSDLYGFCKNAGYIGSVVLPLAGDSLGYKVA